MTTIIIVAIYILGVFAARQYNKWMFKKNEEYGIAWQLWCFSWVFIIMTWWMLIDLKLRSCNFRLDDNWFTGKYWKDE
jgi:hypothetical protein